MGWVTLKSVYSPVEAEIIKDLLESAGISVRTLSSKVSPYPVNVGKMGEIRIMVREEDIHDAMALIKSVEEK